MSRLPTFEDEATPLSPKIEEMFKSRIHADKAHDNWRVMYKDWRCLCGCLGTKCYLRHCDEICKDL